MENKNTDFIQHALDHEKKAFVDKYTRNREAKNMRDSLCDLYEEYFKPLREKLVKLEAENERLKKELENIANWNNHPH